MARKNERHRSAGKKSPVKDKTKTVNDELNLLQESSRESLKQNSKWEKPKKLSKRQAKRLEQEAASVEDAKSPPSSKKKKTLLTEEFKGPSSPAGDKMGRSGNIAYGGHGEEWKNTSAGKRLSNNHMLRIKREQAARVRQLEAQENPASLLSGKAKKAFLKEKRALKKKKIKDREEQEEKEAEEAAEVAKALAAANNLAFRQLQLESKEVAQAPAELGGGVV